MFVLTLENPGMYWHWNVDVGQNHKHETASEMQNTQNTYITPVLISVIWTDSQG